MTAPPALLLALALPAWAGGLDSDVIGARAVGRAGAVTVSEDGGAALLVNPAGLARREGWRIQIGMRVDDSDSSWQPPSDTEPDDMGLQVIDDRAGAATAPQLSVQGALGSIVVGLGYLEATALARELPRPLPGELNEDTATAFFPHRYGGTGLAFRRRSLLAGAAMRALPWLGVGIAVSASRLEYDEARHIWAGSTAQGHAVGSPDRDLALSMSAVDNFVPGASAGVLIAPLELPLELAISASFSLGAKSSGSVALEHTRDAELVAASPFPKPELSDAACRISLPGQLSLRAGVRYLGERFLVEAGADYTRRAGNRRVWSFDGVSVRDEAQTLAVLESAPALIDFGDHGALRIAADVEVVRGFLWLLAGYARHIAESPAKRYAPVYAAVGGHMVAFGAEGQWNGLTLTIGYSRVITSDVQVDTSDVAIVNPFDDGTSPIGQGTYGSSRDLFGAAVEVSWE